MGNYFETFEAPYYPSFRRPARRLAENSKAYERSDDEIAADLVDHLAGLHGIDASAVEVKAEHGNVTLTGPVDSTDIAKYLESIAANTLGVRSVHSELQVTRASAITR